MSGSKLENLKLWTTLLDLYSLEAVSRSEIETFVLAAYRLHEEAVGEEMGRRKALSIAGVRFEQLVADPVSQMERLYAEPDFGPVHRGLTQTRRLCGAGCWAQA